MVPIYNGIVITNPYVIDLNLESLAESSIQKYVRAQGVYILWNPGAKLDVTYIGEGVILDRLRTHFKEWLTAKSGYCGLVARTDERVTSKKAKFNAVIAEAFLIYVGGYYGWYPKRNKNQGHINDLLDLVESHDVVEMNISGYHPFKRPDENSTMWLKKKLSLVYDKDNPENPDVIGPRFFDH